MTAHVQSAPHYCPVCEASAALVFEHAVLGKCQAQYYLCSNCRFVFARPADWLADAYSSALALTDTGAVQRSIFISKLLLTFAAVAGIRNSRGLDVGGGHGLLVRMLRDRGLDFRWSDDHAENLFARGFEDDGGTYEWCTLIEVFEHLVEPGAFLAELVRRRSPRCIFLTTELKSTAVPPLTWRYWSFETGQHIGFAERESLETLARRLGYRLTTRGGCHLLHREAKAGIAFALANTRIRHLYAIFAQRFLRTLTIRDHLALADRLRTCTGATKSPERSICPPDRA